MKRIPVVGLLSLVMLAATSARGDYYGEGTTMRPDSHRSFRDRTSPKKSYIGGRKTRYLGPGSSYRMSGTYRTNVRGRYGEERQGWIGHRKNAVDLPGVGGHADEDQWNPDYYAEGNVRPDSYRYERMHFRERSMDETRY